MRRRPVTLAAILGLLAVAAGCRQVAESRRIEPLAFDAPAQHGCASRLGSYALPKGLLVLELTSDPDGGMTLKQTGERESARFVGVRRVVDEHVCLEHLSSPTADDKIEIIKAQRLSEGGANALAQLRATNDSAAAAVALTRQTPFLGAAVANSLDRSAEIALRLIRAGFILATGDAGFGTNRTRATRPVQEPFIERLSFDPFDPSDLARVNRRLTSVGYCVMIDGLSLPQGVDPQRYCANPQIAAAQPAFVGAAYVAMRRDRTQMSVDGLMYRPREDYAVAIYRKRDVRGREPWRLMTMETVALENLSPLLTLRIGRNLFAGRRAAFLFDEGALVASCLSSTSELLGFVEIPLEISRSLVELPASILSVQIGAATRDRTLARAERQVLDLQRQAIAANNAAITRPETFESGPSTRTPDTKLEKIKARDADFDNFQQAACGPGSPRQEP